MEMLRQFPQHVVLFQHHDGVVQPTAEQHRFNGVPADQHRGYGQQDQWYRDNQRRFPGGVGQLAGRSVVVVVTVSFPALHHRPARLAVEGQVQQPEAVQRGDQHPEHDGEIGDAAAPAMRFRDRLDDGVLGVKSR